MKQNKRLTRTQKEVLTAYNLNANEWEYVKDVGETYIQVMNKSTRKIKNLDKYRRKSKWE